MERKNSRQQVQLGFKTIIVSIAIMLAIILTGIYSMKFIVGKLQESFVFSEKIKQFEANATKLHILVFELMDQRDKQQQFRNIDETSQIEKLLNQYLGEIIAEHDRTDVEMNKVLDQLSVNIEQRKKFNEHIKQTYLTNNTDEAREIFKKEANELASQTQALFTKLESISSMKIDKLSGFSALVLNGSLISLLIIGLIQIFVAIWISKRIMSIFSRILKEIREGVAVVGTSTAEIQTTVSEISTGAAETSTAIAETSTTMEEIRQTSLLSSEKANNLNNSAQKAYDYAEQGLESSQRMIEAIQKIESHMALVKTTIQRLSEQNRSIGEITSTVSDIADQSNLLAVNAAIEAAKAGEHGRGFTIVAQEIRSLAEQSKKSTAQVREILNEIQKSVQEAVVVINQGSETVNMGSELVHTDRQIVEMLTATVEQALEASIQIASSSQQQMAGMGQIVPALENIRIASEQNLLGIKQAELAAKNINSLGVNLNVLMDKYQF